MGHKRLALSDTHKLLPERSVLAFVSEPSFLPSGVLGPDVITVDLFTPVMEESMSYFTLFTYNISKPLKKGL